MAESSLVIVDFQAGIGTLGEKRDKPGSARFTQNLDPFEDYDYVTLARATTKISSTTVATQPAFMEDGNPFTTNRYVISNMGEIYAIDASNVVSLLRETDQFGKGFKVFDDYLYYMLSYITTSGGGNIGRYGPLSGTPVFNDDLTSWWSPNMTDLRTTGGGTGSADYVPPTSISEVATARQTFTATHDPVKKITIDVDVVGSGNWTITIHDAENNLVGTSTIANASMATGDVVFSFIDSNGVSPRVTIGNEYHFHVTSTVADGGVDTDAATDLEGAEFTVEYGVLVRTVAGFFRHPSVVLEDLLIIGNERYLATFDQSTYEPNKIAFDPGYQVTTLTKTEEYIIAECYKPNKTGTVNSFTKGSDAKRYYWDGISPSFNYSEPIASGIPNATVPVSPENFIGIYGLRGSLYDGKTGKQLTEEIPRLTKGEYVNIYSGAIDVYQGRVVVGVCGSKGDSEGIAMGVYEYGGQSSSETPVGLNLPYTISTGNTVGEFISVTMVKAIGEDLYIGWYDNSQTPDYGIDLVTMGGSATTSGLYESLIIDEGNSKKEKLALVYTATFRALAAGESVQLGYKINRAADWTMGTAEDTDGATQVELPIYSRYKEIELKFVLSSSAGTFPKVTSLILSRDLLGEEKVE